MSIGWIMGGFFVFCLMLFIAIALFLPEWVGITGKVAQKNISEHQESKTTTEQENKTN